MMYAFPSPDAFMDHADQFILAVEWVNTLPSAVKRIWGSRRQRPWLLAIGRTISDQTLVRIAKTCDWTNPFVMWFSYIIGVAISLLLIIIAEGTWLKMALSGESNATIQKYIKGYVMFVFFKNFMTEWSDAVREKKAEVDKNSILAKLDKAEVDKNSILAKLDKAEADRQADRLADRKAAEADRQAILDKLDKAEADQQTSDAKWNTVNKQLIELKAANNDPQMVERYKKTVFQEHQTLISSTIVNALQQSMSNLNYEYLYNPLDYENTPYKSNIDVYQQTEDPSSSPTDPYRKQFVANPNQEAHNCVSEVLEEIINRIEY